MIQKFWNGLVAAVENRDYRYHPDPIDGILVVGGFIAFCGAVSHVFNIIIGITFLGCFWIAARKYPFFIWLFARGAVAMLVTFLAGLLLVGVVQTLDSMLFGSLGSSPSALAWSFHSFSTTLGTLLFAYYPVAYHIVWALMVLRHYRR